MLKEYSYLRNVEITKYRRYSLGCVSLTSSTFILQMKICNERGSTDLHEKFESTYERMKASLFLIKFMIIKSNISNEIAGMKKLLTFRTIKVY